MVPYGTQKTTGLCTGGQSGDPAMLALRVIDPANDAVPCWTVGESKAILAP